MAGCNPQEDGDGDDGDEDVDDEDDLAVDFFVGDFVVEGGRRNVGCKRRGGGGEPLGEAFSCRRVEEARVGEGFLVAAQTGHQGGVFGSRSGLWGGGWCVDGC